MKNLLLLLLFSAGLILVSCKKDDDNTGDCDTTDLTYNKDIKAILDTNCALSGCHSETEADLQGAMHDYASAKAFADFGRMVGAIKHEENFKPMPYPEGSDKLDACLIDKIEAWIAAGAPE